MTNKEQILSVAQAYHDMVAEASLVGNQKKLDVNDNDKIDAADLAALRAGAKANEAAQEPEAPAADEPQPTAEVPQAQAPEAPAPAPAPEAPDAEKQDDDEEKELDESSKKAWHATLVRYGVMSRGEFMKTWAKKGPGLSDAERAERGRAGRERVAAYANKQKAATNEALDPKADAGEWISDFVHSTDPKFDGKSKEERTQQALAAYYQARRDAGLKEEVMTEATASELSKQAHALSSKAKTPGDHKKAAHAHYKAATALRRHTTANAAKTGPKADAAHTSALEHEKLGDKHYGKSMVEESAIKVSVQKPMSEYERFKDDLKYHERMYGTRDYTGDKERDDRYAGMKKKLETLRAQHLASMKKESAETIGENYGFNVHATNLTTAANQASALAHSTPAEAGALKAHDAATRAHQEAADHYGVVAQHATDPQQKRVAQIHHQFHSDMATHHTLHGLTLSMDEQTVNEAKSCEEEVGTTEADWDAHYCAQTPEMQEAITRGKNVGLRYPEAYKVARNVVRKEGTEEPRAQGEKDFKNMHDDNIEISNDPAASGSVTGADKVTQAEKPSTPNNPPVMDVKSLKSVAEAYVNMLNKG
jgi:hypothetical protein